MLTKPELEFINKNREYLEGDLTLFGLYNKAAYHLGISSAKKIVILYAESEGSFGFKVKAIRSDSTHYKYFYQIVSRIDQEDRFKLYDTLPTTKILGRVSQEKAIEKYIHDLGISFSSLKNLRANTAYFIKG